MRVKKAAAGSDRVNEDLAVRAAGPQSRSVLESNGGWERAAARGRELLAAVD